jgi:hypothetical protein
MFPPFSFLFFISFACILLLYEGSDISIRLIEICRESKHEVVAADGLSLPFHNNSFDFTINIAVLHHISTLERRQQVFLFLLSVSFFFFLFLPYLFCPTLLGIFTTKSFLFSFQLAAELIRVTRSGGRVLVYAWAMEQDDSSRRKFEQQDCFVPWHMPLHYSQPNSSSSSSSSSSTPASSSSSPANQANDPSSFVVLQRYCHVFRKGELEDLFVSVGGHVIHSFYDHANWCVVISKPRQQTQG